MSYYIGSTNNLKQRLEYHQKGRVRSTKNKLPFSLCFSKEFRTRSEAQSFEYKIKKWKSRKAIERLINLALSPACLQAGLMVSPDMLKGL